MAKEKMTFIAGRRAIRETQSENHAKDIVQPYNRDGSLSKEFKKLYPNSEFVKRNYKNE